MEYTLTTKDSLALADIVLKDLEGDREETALWIKGLHEVNREQFKIEVYSVQDDDMIHSLLCLGKGYDRLIETSILSGHTATVHLAAALADWALDLAADELLQDFNDADLEDGDKGLLFDSLSESKELAEYVLGKIAEEYPHISELPDRARLYTYSHKRGCGHSCGHDCDHDCSDACGKKG